MTITTQRIALCGTLLALIACDGVPRHNATILWERHDLATPESALYDDERRVIYVSVMDGGPTDKDSKGGVAILSDTGEMTGMLVDSLHAPKGIGRYQDTLYVADVDRIVIINRYDGTHRFIAVRHAQFLNDVTVDDTGIVYISDMVTGLIHMLPHDGTAQDLTHMTHKDVPHPNGLLWSKDGLWIAGWGQGMQEDFSTDGLGRLSLYDKDTETLTAMTEPLGNLDGIVKDVHGRLLITDWGGGGVFVYDDGDVYLAYDTEKGSADIGYREDDDTLFLPMMLENRVMALTIP
ncbi:MAG: SMP-30/gluconolactonase/LRE family protein [Alphaproteobacteria bacterium GM7ARS4]|nr:SMP-30/gluconolactonase/LRE family protein [Alphaproteobacteria bacterium GM7ARS4]